MPRDQPELDAFSNTFVAADVAAALEADLRGLPVALDLCDNIFIPAYGAKSALRPADAFRSMAQVARLITCTTEPMAQLIRAELGMDVRVCVVPDSIETEGLVKQQELLLDRPLPGATTAGSRLRSIAAGAKFWLADRMRRAARQNAAGVDEQLLEPRSGNRADQAIQTIVWFGNHGSEHGDHGLNDILRFRGPLEAVAAKYNLRLIVVSNHQQRYEQLIASMSLQTQYFEWSPAVLAQALAAADITIVPNSLDEFSIGKSANRSVMSLCAGVPVVATPTAALAPLAGAVWTDDPLAGLETYLSEPDKAAADVTAGRELIETHFSLDAVGRQWRDCFESLLR